MGDDGEPFMYGDDGEPFMHNGDILERPDLFYSAGTAGGRQVGESEVEPFFLHSTSLFFSFFFYIQSREI